MDDRERAYGTPEEQARLSRASVFSLLADERRLTVIEQLQQMRVPLAVADLAREIATRESEHSSINRGDHQDTVLQSLHHCHVPKLVDAGVVAYDETRNTVERGVNFQRVAAVLNALPDDEPGTACAPVDGSTD